MGPGLLAESGWGLAWCEEPPCGESRQECGNRASPPPCFDPHQEAAPAHCSSREPVFRAASQAGGLDGENTRTHSTTGSVRDPRSQPTIKGLGRRNGTQTASDACLLMTGSHRDFSIKLHQHPEHVVQNQSVTKFSNRQRPLCLQKSVF